MSSIRPLLCALVGCASGALACAQPLGAADTSDPHAADTLRPCSASSAQQVAQLTPLVMQVVNRPVPFKGGDGSYHLAYELTLENFGGDRVRVDNLQVLDADAGVPLADLDPAM